MTWFVLRSALTSLLIAGTCCSATAMSQFQSESPNPAPDDPYLWLEDVLGESQLAWVERCNARCLDDVGDPRGTECYSRIKDILDSKVREEGGFFWNS